MSNITGQNRIAYQLDTLTNAAQPIHRLEKQNRIAYQLDTALGLHTISGNAPVTRATWQCSNLPDGLILSQSGLLTGRPTVAGIFECIFTVTTNWGTDTKTLNIIIEE